MLPEREETTQAIRVPSFLPGGKLWTVEHEWDPKQNIFKSELWRHKSELWGSWKLWGNWGSWKLWGSGVELWRRGCYTEKKKKKKTFKNLSKDPLTHCWILKCSLGKKWQKTYQLSGPEIIQGWRHLSYEQQGYQALVDYLAHSNQSL